VSDDWTLALTAWNWEPTVLAGVALLAAGYLVLTGPQRWRFPGSSAPSRSQTACFMSGLLVILFALVSPLDTLGDEYLFSAHMIQHLLITFVGPPLLLAGTPGWLLRPALSRPALFRLARFFTNPLLAFAVFNGNFMAWHVPALYSLTLENELLHVVEHLLFMATAVLAWWPILSPLDEMPRLPYPAQILFLFFQMLPMTLLGAMITFAPEPLYPHYVDAPRLFGASIIADQEGAGLLMWMPGGMIYLLAVTVIFFKWVGKEEEPYDRRIVPRT
jgi:putative membrane protein